MDNTVDRFRTAVEERDLATVNSLFAEDIRFFSPVKFTPFEGLPLVRGLFGVLLRVFEDFRYVGELQGEAELGDRGPVESHILIFRATVNGKAVHGIDLIQLDDQGLIEEFTVMVRPRSAVDALSEAVFAGLVADGLVPGA